MGKISIVDLEVFGHVGVSEEERAQPQRLLVSVEMDFDFSMAAMHDRIEKTIDYFKVAQVLMTYIPGRSWKLIEKLATDITTLIMAEFRPEQVLVEVKKFPLPQARYVSAMASKTRAT